MGKVNGFLLDDRSEISTVKEIYKDLQAVKREVARQKRFRFQVLTVVTLLVFAIGGIGAYGASAANAWLRLAMKDAVVTALIEHGVLGRLHQ